MFPTDTNRPGAPKDPITPLVKWIIKATNNKSSNNKSSEPSVMDLSLQTPTQEAGLDVSVKPGVTGYIKSQRGFKDVISQMFKDMNNPQGQFPAPGYRAPNQFNIDNQGGIGLDEMFNQLNQYEQGRPMPTDNVSGSNAYNRMNPWEGQYQGNVISGLNRQMDNNINEMNNARGNELYSRARMSNEQDIRNDTQNTIAGLLNQQYNTERGMQNASYENQFNRDASLYGNQLGADTTRFTSGLSALGDVFGNANQTAFGGYNSYLANETSRIADSDKIALDSFIANSGVKSNDFAQLIQALTNQGNLGLAPLGINAKENVVMAPSPPSLLEQIFGDIFG